MYYKIKLSKTAMYANIGIEDNVIECDGYGEDCEFCDCNKYYALDDEGNPVEVDLVLCVEDKLGEVKYVEYSN